MTSPTVLLNRMQQAIRTQPPRDINSHQLAHMSVQAMHDRQPTRAADPPQRPACPTCGGPIHQMRRAHGIVAAYPCACWLTPRQAQTIADRHHANTTEANP